MEYDMHSINMSAQNFRQSFWKSRKFLAIALGLVAFLFLFFVLLKQKTAEEGTVKPMPVKSVSNQVLPEYFPADLPLGQEVEVQQNYTAAKGAETQSTRVYVTDKPLMAKASEFDAYFRDNGWGFDGSSLSEPPDLVYLSARKLNRHLMITLTKQVGTNYTQVVLNMITYERKENPN